MALPEPVSAAAKKVWEEMKNNSSVAIQFRRDRLGNYFMKVLTYIGLTANVHLPYETPLKFVPREGFVKDADSEAVPTFSDEYQTPAERQETPAVAASFSHGADQAIMDMTQSILGQISHLVPPPKPVPAPNPVPAQNPVPAPNPAPAPGMGDRTSFADAETETKKRAKYSFAAAMKEEG